eukprot:2052442-Prymnesium_polylepis.2
MPRTSSKTSSWLFSRSEGATVDSRMSLVSTLSCADANVSSSASSLLEAEGIGDEHTPSTEKDGTFEWHKSRTSEESSQPQKAHNRAISLASRPRGQARTCDNGSEAVATSCCAAVRLCGCAAVCGAA